MASEIRKKGSERALAINREKVFEGAQKLLQAAKYDKAIVEFQKLIAEDDKDVRTLLKIAETLHVKMGKRKEALESYDRAANIYREQGFFLKSVAVFKQMLTVDATNPDIHLRLAELYQQLGYASQCLLHYQSVVQLYEQQERGKDTLAILKRMVDLDPENLQSRIKVAELFAQNGHQQAANTEMRSAYEFLKSQLRLDDAVRVGEKVVAWDPGAIDVARELANIYMGRGDAKQALPKLQMCFRVDPQNLELLGLIAEAFRALDQTPKTISVYKEMARIYDSNNDAATARKLWQQIIELSPGDEDAELALGQRAATSVAGGAFAATGPRPSAEDDQLARLLTETNVYVKYNLHAKAIDHLEKIFSIRPDYIPGLEKLKVLQAQTKQGAAVAETLRRLVARGTEVSHPQVPEWKIELAQFEQKPTVKKSSLAPPPSKDGSVEGEVILLDEAGVTPAPLGLGARAGTAGGRSTPARPATAHLTHLAPDTDELLSPKTDKGDRSLPPDEELDDAPSGHMVAPVQPLSVPRTASGVKISLPPLEELEIDYRTSEEAVVKRTTGIRTGVPQPSPRGAAWAPDMGSPEHAADELILDQQEAPEPRRQPPPAPVDVDEGGVGGVQTVNGTTPRSLAVTVAPATDLLSLSDDDLNELQSFLEKASSEGAAVLPALGGADDDDDDDEGAATLDGDDDNFFVPPASAPVGPTNDDGDDVNVETGELAGRSKQHLGLVLPFVAKSSPNTSDVGADGSAGKPGNKFDPNHFDLPADVGAILAKIPVESPPPSLADFDGVADESTGALEISLTGQFDGSIPSLASVDAAAIIEMSPPPSCAPPAVVDASNVELPSQARNLFQATRGFEDDPANTFFPDELAEAEFFIQQDLLDEAREILTPILEEIEDSLRVQHMLARVTAKEAGEPEPHAPWEQRLIDEVGAQLSDMAALSPPVESSGPHQMSVEDVLSQFKKGVAETVPEEDAATHYDLGVAYREMGLLEDAVAEFEIAARAPTREADAFYVVGLVRLEQGRADEALSALQKAVDAPSASKAQKAAAEYERGIVFDEHKNDGRESLICLKRSKQLGGTVPDLDRRIAALQKVHGDIDVPALDRSLGS